MSARAALLIGVFIVAEEELEIPEEIVTPRLAEPTEGRITPTPYSFAFGDEDGLRLTVTSSLSTGAVAIHYRTSLGYRETTAARYTLPLGAAYTTVSREFPIGRGYLLNVTAMTEGINPTVGQCFVKLEVIRGRGASSIVLGTILQGYVTSTQNLAWPGSPIIRSIEGPGALQTLTPADPGVGVEWLVSAPPNARWIICSFSARFTASAAVGDRRPRLTMRTAGLILWDSPAIFVSAAGQIARYIWAPGCPYTSLIGFNPPPSNIPDNYPMTTGTEFITLSGMLAGDFWSTALLRVYEWLEVN
jgi:hypothetical protein